MSPNPLMRNSGVCVAFVYDPLSPQRAYFARGLPGRSTMRSSRVWREGNTIPIEPARLFDHLPLATLAGRRPRAGRCSLALAGHTPELRLGVLATCDPLRPSAMLPKLAATVDIVSGGRLMVGYRGAWTKAVEQESYLASGDPVPVAARLCDKRGLGPGEGDPPTSPWPSLRQRAVSNSRSPSPMISCPPPDRRVRPNLLRGDDSLDDPLDRRPDGLRRPPIPVGAVEDLGDAADQHRGGL
jgi:hypothetical protein